MGDSQLGYLYYGSVPDYGNGYDRFNAEHWVVFPSGDWVEAGASVGEHTETGGCCGGSPNGTTPFFFWAHTYSGGYYEVDAPWGPNYNEWFTTKIETVGNYCWYIYYNGTSQGCQTQHDRDSNLLEAGLEVHAYGPVYVNGANYDYEAEPYADGYYSPASWGSWSSASRSWESPLCQVAPASVPTSGLIGSVDFADPGC